MEDGGDLIATTVSAVHRAKYPTHTSRSEHTVTHI